MNKYYRGVYDKSDYGEQWIRISEGCPNNCPYCRETKECGKEPIYFEIPKIVRNIVKIMDMNLIYKPKCIEILDYLGSQKVSDKVVHYELICGIDWRYMTQEKADALKRNRFKNIRFAWDGKLEMQYKIKDCYKMLIKAGYRAEDLMCFMICDYIIPFEENLMKLDLLKIWNVKVSDCYYDNVTPPNYQCNYWSMQECITFKALCSIHNQSVSFGLYPVLKRVNRTMNKIKSLKNQTNLLNRNI